MPNRSSFPPTPLTSRVHVSLTAAFFSPRQLDYAADRDDPQVGVAWGVATMRALMSV